jgi:hypothetical protein
LLQKSSNFSLISISSIFSVRGSDRNRRFAGAPSVEERVAQPVRFKKDRFGQQAVNRGQNAAAENPTIKVG